MPAYTIEPPDVLTIEAVNVVPRAPYYLHTLDVLAIQVQGALPDSPIVGNFAVEPGGTINLGLPYGRLKVSKLTIDEAVNAIKQHLKHFVKETPEVSAALLEVSGKQQIAGEHLVAADGTITLGTYGGVKVVGKTLAEAKVAIEQYLSKTLEDPEVAVTVYAYNSKNYYIVTQGAGLGDGVVRFPITGNETVLDAIAQIKGLKTVSSTKIWVARPAPAGEGCDQILQVDWNAITQRGVADSNYQLFPGDRVYVAEDCLVAADTHLGKVLSPAERVFGFISLGTSTVSGLRFFNQGPNGVNNGGGFN
jgi:polysaccharide export outer membrane protein